MIEDKTSRAVVQANAITAFFVRKDTVVSNAPTGLADGLEVWSPLSRDANSPRGAGIAPVGPPRHVAVS
jgi:hypothetical protein